MIALIPARSGSKRIKDKNIRLLFGFPLMSYTINVALLSGLFDNVYVSSDSPIYLEIAKRYGAEIIQRPLSMSDDLAPDQLWIEHALSHLKPVSHFMILRPTNPFRTEGMLKRAYKLSQENPKSEIRAVERVKQHPYKMWEISMDEIIPAFTDDESYRLPTQSLPDYFVQNGSLEIRPTKKADKIIPFFTQGFEGFDLNYETDWLLAEKIYDTGNNGQLKTLL